MYIVASGHSPATHKIPPIFASSRFKIALEINVVKKAIKYALAFGFLTAVAIPVCAAVDIIPCAPGNRWEYDCVKVLRAKISLEGQTMATLYDPASGTSVYEVLGADTKVKPTVYDYCESTRMKSLNGNTDDSKTQMNITNDGGILKILSTAHESSAEKETKKQSYDPALTYFTKDAVAGKSWNVGVMRDEDIRTPVTAHGAGKETVTVPAGTFKDCVKVIYSSDDVSGTMQMWGQTFTLTAAHTRGIYWVADGVGVVKEMEVNTSTAQAEGPEGKPVNVEYADCVISELKPGYTVKN